MPEVFYLKTKILVKGAKAPQKREEDAGFDIWSIENKNLPSLMSHVFRTGIATEFPIGYVGLIFDRGSMGIKGIMRRAGVVDSGFRNEWMVCLFNSSPTVIEIESVLINPQAKAMAQVVFAPCMHTNVQIVDELGDSKRGEKWFGSTDAGNNEKKD